MHWLQWIIAGAWMNLCAAWLYILWLQVRAKRNGMMLQPAAWDPSMAAPSVAVVIAARDEIENLEDCVNSLLLQRYPNYSIVLVDDRSCDGTSNVADDLAATHERICAIHVDHLPSGWLGKSHALWTGTSQVQNADWLLFTDADCRFDPLAIATAVRAACEREADLFSVWPATAAQSFWEHALIPLCAAIIALWFAPAGIASPIRSQSRPRGDANRPFANGQFLLVRKSTYERIGGHAAVRRAIIEDVALAEHAKLEGARIVVAGGASIVSVRMYRDFLSIHRGWSRIYVGALRGKVEILLSILWLLIGSLMPFIMLPYLVIANLPVLTAVCLVHLIVIGIVSYRFWGLGHCSRRHLCLYPAFVIVTISVLVRSFWTLAIAKRLTWRGTTYNLRGRMLIPSHRSCRQTLSRAGVRIQNVGRRQTIDHGGT